jgi:methylenetetrahydrofolate dehydrogenase (NADP+)/methenyltetrahydrofolate cyclohydrolase
MNEFSKILDGKKTSDFIISDVRREIIDIIELSNESSVRISSPKLGIILVGNNQASESYVRNKVKACEKAGIENKLVQLDNTISEDYLIDIIESMNSDESISGFIVQLPLPNHVDVNRVINTIHPDKDVDGFHPTNFGRTALGLSSLKPATPYGILKLLKLNNINTKGKHVVIVGRSNIVGKPLSIMLGNDFEVGRATVTSCDVNTPRDLLYNELKIADIVVVAVGKPNFLNGDMIKRGAIVIDVGINKVGDKIVGDIDFESVMEKCSLVTPVPGGVGPMTIAALIVNTLNSWKRFNKV